MLDFSVTFFITIINITVLFLILKAFLFKPVTKFMAERSGRIQTSIDQAEKDKSTAQKMLTQYETRLKNAEKEADGIIQHARDQAETEAERILVSSRKEADRITEAARVKLESERLAAMALFKAEAAALVLSAAGSLLGRELSGKEHQHFAALALEKIMMDFSSETSTGRSEASGDCGV